MLLGKMVVNGHNQASLAEILGVSKNTMSAKINGKRPFNTDEILNICKVLKITNNYEKIDIFLPQTSQ